MTRQHLHHWKYTALLVALLGLMVVHPVLAEGDSLFTLLYAVFGVSVFLGAAVVLFERRRTRVVAFVLGVPTVLGAFASHAGRDTLPGVVGVLFHLFPVLFFGYTAAVILRSIFRNPEVSADGINGAFCGYLLIALAFGHLYCLTEAVRPHSYLLQNHLGPFPAEGPRRYALLSYYSLMTLTTCGYGDILPRSSPARALASVEAVIGQFYVAVVVAQLIALKVSAATAATPADGPDGP